MGRVAGNSRSLETADFAVAHGNQSKVRTIDMVDCAYEEVTRSLGIAAGQNASSAILAKDREADAAM